MNRETTIRLLNGFIETELKTIKEAYASSNLEGDHLDAGLAIAWCCYMFQDWINKEVTSKLTEFAGELVHADNNDWVWLASLLSAAHLLKENKDIRDRLLVQLSHGTASCRYEIVKAVTFMIPTVSFSNSYIKKSVTTNIEGMQGLYQESTILYLCTEGSDDDKRRWTLKAKKRFNEYDMQQTFFERLFDKAKHWHNSFFADTFSTAKSYLLFKLFANPSLSNQQTELLHKAKDTGELFEQLQDQEQAHPLSTSYIDLSCLKEKKPGLFSEE